MIKHIVMWKLKENAEGNTKEENAKIIKTRLEALKGIVKELKDAEVGINVNKSEAAFDVVLYSVVENEADLDAYQNNADHVEVKKFIGKVAEDRKVVDYIL